jgi:DCN1-like protein 4/5
MFLGSCYSPVLTMLSLWVQIQSDYKVINMDQWMGFYRFCNEVLPVLHSITPNVLILLYLID